MVGLEASEGAYPVELPLECKVRAAAAAGHLRRDGLEEVGAGLSVTGEEAGACLYGEMLPEEDESRQRVFIWTVQY